MNAFPFRLYATHVHYSSSPKLAEMVWRRIQKGRTWYAADCEVLNPTSIKLFVYDMYDSCTGGIGECFLTQEFTELTPTEQAELDKVVLERYQHLAGIEFENRREAENQAQILKIRLELFGK